MTTLTKHVAGTFSWAELATSDAEAAKKFYGALFGWAFDDQPAGPDMTYSMAKLGDQTAGALYKMGQEMKGVPPHWLSYVSVDDADATAKKAVAAGGKLIKEPFDVMTFGRMAVVTYPAGATLAIWQPKEHIGATVKNEPGSLAGTSSTRRTLTRPASSTCRRSRGRRSPWIWARWARTRSSFRKART